MNAKAAAALLATALSTGWTAPAQSKGSELLVVDRSDKAGEALGRLMESRLKGRIELRSVSYARDQLADPIYKGKILATLASSRLVIPIGNGPTGFVLGEFDEAPVYFVDASAIPGARLSGPYVGGLLSYSAADVLGALPAAWKRRVGLLYTPGYEGVVRSVRALARAQGVELVERRVARAQDLAAAGRGVIVSASAVWVLGDPLFTREAGLEFLSELALSRGIPLIGSGQEEVRAGAVMCSRGNPETMARQASDGIIRRLAAGEPPAVSTVDAGGTFLYNRALASRYGLAIGSAAWVESR